MDLEKLNKSQIVLLTLLVSFVTSIATGIVTVALMQAMEESCREGRPVKVRDVLARYGLEELADTSS